MGRDVILSVGPARQSGPQEFQFCGKPNLESLDYQAVLAAVVSMLCGSAGAGVSVQELSEERIVIWYEYDVSRVMGMSVELGADSQSGVSGRSWLYTIERNADAGFHDGFPPIALTVYAWCVTRRDLGNAAVRRQVVEWLADAQRTGCPLPRALDIFP